MKALVENPLAGLRAALPQTPQDNVGRDDYALYPEKRQARSSLVPASVLIPVIAHPEPTVLFTQRTAHLSHHSGQVSFPGGRREAHDLSPVQTALRETMEETGIDPAHVSLAGFLPRYLTGTGFDISPVVGVLAPGFALNPDPREVADVFEVPLSFFLDPANVQQASRDRDGWFHTFYIFEPPGRHIWGITAAMLFDLSGRLRTARAIEAP